MSRILFAGLLLTSGCLSSAIVEKSPVRASLTDGQIVQGLVSTTQVRLTTVMGTLSIPIGDIGELEPVEGGHMEDSQNHVKIWLRDGSEWVGQWAEPELEFHLNVGQEWISIDLPMDEMERFQLRDGQYWPPQNAFAVTTTFGDDFIVDTENTQVTLSNSLGEFSPFLRECKSIAPIGDPHGDWRVELYNGTVLIGPLAEETLTFVLSMGPESVTVPLEHIIQLTRDTWTETPVYPKDDLLQRSSPKGWFDNGRYRQTKQLRQDGPSS